MFGNCNDLIIIFNSNLPHDLVFQSRKLCSFEVLGCCFLSLVELAYQENTELSLISDQIVNLLKAIQAPGFARLRLLPLSPLLAPFCDSNTREPSMETLSKYRSRTAGTHNFHKTWTAMSGSSV